MCTVHAVDIYTPTQRDSSVEWHFFSLTHKINHVVIKIQIGHSLAESSRFLVTTSTKAHFILLISNIFWQFPAVCDVSDVLISRYGSDMIFHAKWWYLGIFTINTATGRKFHLEDLLFIYLCYFVLENNWKRNL